jgi:hypothetical protein
MFWPKAVFQILPTADKSLLNKGVYLKNVVEEKGPVLYVHMYVKRQTGKIVVNLEWQLVLSKLVSTIFNWISN